MNLFLISEYFKKIILQINRDVQRNISSSQAGKTIMNIGSGIASGSVNLSGHTITIPQNVNLRVVHVDFPRMKREALRIIVN